MVGFGGPKFMRGLFAKNQFEDVFACGPDRTLPRN